jgi:hypothetical protein
MAKQSKPKSKNADVTPDPSGSPSIMDAIADPDLLGAAFKDQATWSAWFAFLRALFGLELSAAELATFRECTEREAPNAGGYLEAWLICGRRSGKSFVLALVAVFLACFFNWAPYLSAGEVGTIMVVAADRRQAQVILGYVRGLLEIPLLSRLVVSDGAESIVLDNRVEITVQTASFRSIRGRTVIAALLDELAFWRSEHSANPDQEIIRALRPAMSTIPGAMLLCASSPYARKGELFKAFDRWHGKDDAKRLVWRAPSLTMNLALDPAIVRDALAEDEAAARAEYLAEFRTDVEAFVRLDTVRDALGDYRERPPVDGCRYFGFVDPSGGSSDSFTLAIGHRERDGNVVDAIRARKPPFSPSDVVDEFARVLRSYRIREVVGDRYGGEFPRELFRRHDITYRIADKTRSELYQGLLPQLNAGRIVLPNNDELVKQLVGLERRVQRSGRETIDHGPRGHDDIANAVAGVADICVAASMTAVAQFGTYGRLTPVAQNSKFDGLIDDPADPLFGGYATSR